MCILVLALGCHPAIPFVCAHNREENRSRPSGCDVLEPDTQIVCGRDQKAGGMVLGLNAATGSFAALTNCRSEVELGNADKVSRGQLVERLVADGQADSFLSANRGRLDGYHVVFGSACGRAPQLQYLWNAPLDATCGGDEAGGEAQWRTGGRELGTGVFVISNENPVSGIDWPKSKWLQEQVAGVMHSLPEEPQISEVFQGLANIMEQCDVPELAAAPPSVLPKRFLPGKEAWLHRGVYSPWREEMQDFGTVSQRILVSDARAQEIHYSHRSTNREWPGVGAGPPKCGPWEHIRVPWPAQASSPVSRH